ncbi:MAG: Calcium-gated potassium channel MthK [Methanoregulaceae archaeon PtaB.Bin009]|nr:MAG: Calcium-gated potassium channel MthK [Methanoregulaceae archaeon PtaB.Bin009]
MKGAEARAAEVRFITHAGRPFHKMGSYERRLQAYIVLLVSVVVIGVAGFSLLEGFSPLDSFYLTIVTIATVGYGDLHPATEAGKVLAVVVIVAGVGCFVGLVANVVEHIAFRKERARRRQKTMMLVGIFFTQVGTSLLATCARGDLGRQDLSRLLSGPKFADSPASAGITDALASRSYHLDCRELDLATLRDALGEKIDVLSVLLQNPDLDEHSKFTDLLQALFHLWQELSHREVLCGLPGADTAHLSGDLNRVYGLLVLEWVVYLGHLKRHYPYLYSLALRTNPFDEKASVVIRE